MVCQAWMSGVRNHIHCNWVVAQLDYVSILIFQNWGIDNFGGIYNNSNSNWENRLPLTNNRHETRHTHRLQTHFFIKYKKSNIDDTYTQVTCAFALRRKTNLITEFWIAKMSIDTESKTPKHNAPQSCPIIPWKWCQKALRRRRGTCLQIQCWRGMGKNQMYFGNCEYI